MDDLGGNYYDVNRLTKLKEDNKKNPMPRIEKIVSLDSTSHTSIYYLDGNGNVYVSGGRGATGIKTNRGFVEKVTKLEVDKYGNILPEMKKIITNEYSATPYTYYISKAGEVYVSGDNKTGQLGVNGLSVDIIQKIDVDNEGKPLEEIKDIVTNRGSTYYITINGEVYVSGRNDYGQLGVSSDVGKKYVSKLTKIKEDSEGNSLPVINKIVANGLNTSTWYIDEQGGVYVSGRNNYGQLGIGGNVDINVLTKIKEDSEGKDLLPIVDIISSVYDSSSYSTYFIDKEGGVYVAGSNNYGQLGVGGNTNIDKITKLKEDNEGKAIPPIKKIIALPHPYYPGTYYITIDGEVYVSGSNNYGRFGLGTSGTVKKIQKLKVDKIGNSVSEIIDIKVGSNSAIYLKKNGEVYVSGNNISGQIGLGEIESTNVIQRLNVDNKGNLIPAIAKIGNDYFLTEEGDVYVFGVNSHGSLAQGEKRDNILSPTLLKVPDNSYSTLGDITSIYGNSASTIFEEDDGDIYVIGNNTSGKLGIAGTSNIETATKISLKGIKDAGIGSDFAVFLKDNGSIVGYGNASRNGNGLTNISQIAVQNNKAYFMKSNGNVVDNKNNIITTGAYKIAAGSNHLVVLKKDGTTETFGQANSGLTNVIDIFAGKDMTVYVTADNKTHIMENDTLTTLSIKGIVYAELNGEQPYFITYDRDLIDRDGNAIKFLDTKLQWVKEVKGDVVLNERMRVYDLSKL